MGDAVPTPPAPPPPVKEGEGEEEGEGVAEADTIPVIDALEVAHGTAVLVLVGVEMEEAESLRGGEAL